MSLGQSFGHLPQIQKFLKIQDSRHSDVPSFEAFEDGPLLASSTCVPGGQKPNAEDEAAGSKK